MIKLLNKSEIIENMYLTSLKENKELRKENKKLSKECIEWLKNFLIDQEEYYSCFEDRTYSKEILDFLKLDI